VLQYANLPIEAVLQFVRDKHPRVRFAAVNCLAHLASDFAPGIQQATHELFIPAVVSVLEEKSLPRLQCVAANAIVNFVEWVRIAPVAQQSIGLVDCRTRTMIVCDVVRVRACVCG
jgi:hypothetical protein